MNDPGCSVCRDEDGVMAYLPPLDRFVCSECGVTSCRLHVAYLPQHGYLCRDCQATHPDCVQLVK